MAPASGGYNTPGRVAGDDAAECAARPGEKRSIGLCHLFARTGGERRGGGEDRKSTRLNSSHVRISYAVFCLKKKKINEYNQKNKKKQKKIKKKKQQLKQ